MDGLSKRALDFFILYLYGNDDNDDDNDADNDDDNDDEGMILTARLTFWQASSTGLFSPTSPTASRALSMF